MTKKIKTLLTMIAAVMAMILPAGMCSLKASAESPATFHLSYAPDKGGWYVLSYSWWDNQESEELTQQLMSMQFLYSNIKDGDVVVITNDNEEAPMLELDSIRLSNLTLMLDCAFTMIKAGGIDEVYALKGSCCSISAPVNNATLYDRTQIQFHDNVGNIVITSDEDILVSSAACTGTVGSLTVKFPDNSSYAVYNFRPNTLNFQAGVLQTSEDDFSAEPSSDAPVQPVQPVPDEPSQPSSDDYDQVPKTGDTNTAAWLFFAGIFGIVLSCGLRGKKISG